MLTQEEIVEIAEDLLSNRFGGQQEITETDRLSGSGSATVLRARVAPSHFLQQRSVILKYIPDTGDPLDHAALVREVVAYQFTTSLPEDVRPGPVLLAHDISRRILVITDSGDGDTFADLLTTTGGEQRIQILRNLGQALGRMHAGTSDREEDFDILMARMLRSHPESSDINRLRDRALVFSIQAGMELLSRAGFEIPQLVHDLAKDAERRMLTGRHRAFTPFDLSPDNIIVAERTHFLDYEWAGFRDVSFDIASVVAGFPQFLFARPVSDDEADVFIDSWMREVGDRWPNAKIEEETHLRVTAALIGWLLESISLMHFGSLTNTVVALRDLENAPELPKSLGIPDTPVISDMDSLGEILRPRSEGPFTEDELLVRQDLYETAEALSRFASRNKDPRLGSVGSFASEIADRVAEDQG
ncbi:phosphotransferase family protein [Corynebacterium halotolerans]|uniref:phosphotransferase family protein n=1 Tax=Corynebacterium halotolerans TaxID=225326 RepID=UPI003CF643DC